MHVSYIYSNSLRRPLLILFCWYLDRPSHGYEWLRWGGPAAWSVSLHVIIAFIWRRPFPPFLRILLHVLIFDLICEHSRESNVDKYTFCRLDIVIPTSKFQCLLNYRRPLITAALSLLFFTPSSPQLGFFGTVAAIFSAIPHYCCPRWWSIP